MKRLAMGIYNRLSPGDKSKFYTKALTIAPDGTDVFVLDPWGGASHFVWRNTRHVLAWARHPSHQDRLYFSSDMFRRTELFLWETLFHRNSL